MYDSYLQELIQLNFLPVCIILFLGIFLCFNDAYEHELTQHFIPPLLLLIGLVLIDNIDYYLLNGKEQGFSHILTAVAGYNFRICLLVSLILIALRNSMGRWKFLLYVPAVVNFLVTSLAFFTHLIFWYGPDGDVVRGPLAYTPHTISLLYSALLIAYGIRIGWHGRRNESVIICLTTFLSVVGTAVETIFQLRGILIGVVAMDVTFYYLYIHIENFKVDTLTGALNRTSFYADIRKLGSRMDVTVVSIDLNNLKKINDSQGHSAGDKAIRETARLIQGQLKRGCRLYRVGGDEFVVICVGTVKAALRQLREDLLEAMDGSPYSFSMGFATRELGESFDEVYVRADQEMYRDKQASKEARA